MVSVFSFFRLYLSQYKNYETLIFHYTINKTACEAGISDTFIRSVPFDISFCWGAYHWASV